ncbi:MAG: lytic murein transglycosylase B [Pseudomonadales bacterium]|nr:lytic murein transglycosylase B [Pseudomonadales bacterium]
MSRLLYSACILVLSLATANVAAGSYADRDDVKAFVATVAAKHKMDEAELLAIIAHGVKKQKILDAISRPAEKRLNWGSYRNIFLEPRRIAQGVEFWKKHEKLINDIAAEYKVAPEIIMAIIGVETRYGRLTGGYKVLDALLTLGFDYPKRGKFFRGQLEQFLLLSKEQGLDATELTGSYAGAMGYGQFIPGSYRAYAVDHDKDGVADIWNNPADAIASVANYFAKHKWTYGDLVAVPITLNKGQVISDKLITGSVKPKKTVAYYRKAGVPIPRQIRDDEKVALLKFETADGVEYWLGFDNFYTITRYNHSQLYAMAAFQFSQLLKTHVIMK